MKRSWFVLAGSLLTTATLVSAQVVQPEEDDLAGVQAPFQNLVRGRSDKIDQSKRGSLPQGGMQGPKAIKNPSTDPHDLRGQWSAGRGGMPPGNGPGAAANSPPPNGGPTGAPPANIAASKAPAAPPAPGGDVASRPGPHVNTTIDANRMCLVEPGVNTTGGKFYQSDRELTIVLDDQLRVRRIRLNAEHAKEVKPSYNGDSVGHWDGNTLVVDTIGIKGALGKMNGDVERGWHTLLMTTPTLHVIERITKSADGSQLVINRRYEDPATGMQSYTQDTTLNYTEDSFGTEAECEDFGDAFGPDYAAKN